VVVKIQRTGEGTKKLGWMSRIQAEKVGKSLVQYGVNKRLFPKGSLTERYKGDRDMEEK